LTGFFGDTVILSLHRASAGETIIMQSKDDATAVDIRHALGEEVRFSLRVDGIANGPTNRR
jgi:hypothetical protein